MKKSIFVLSVATLLMAGCNSEVEIQNPNEIRINASLGASRATLTNFEVGDKMSLYAVEYNDQSAAEVQTVGNYINNEQQAGREINVPDVAASFQQAVLDVIVAKAVGSAEALGKDKLVLAGGVASNSKLRNMLEEECKKKGIELYFPSPILCTDNAAMIGCAAYYKYKAGGVDGLDLDAHANLAI